MPRPLRSLRPSPTIRYSVPCRVPAPPSHPGCSPPSGNNGSATRAPRKLQKYTGIAPVTERSGKKQWVHWRLQCPKFLRQTFVLYLPKALHPCNPGSSNGPGRPSLARSGPLPTIGSSVTGDVPTKPPYAPWPSSGSESSIAAGRTARPMTNRPTSMRSNAAARHYSIRSPRALRTLDSPPQGVG